MILSFGCGFRDLNPAHAALVPEARALVQVAAIASAIDRGNQIGYKPRHPAGR